MQPNFSGEVERLRKRFMQVGSVRVSLDPR